MARCSSPLPLALAALLLAAGAGWATPAGRAPRRPAPAVATLPAPPSDDPRVALHVLWDAGDRQAVLAKVDAALAENGPQARAWGYDYLRGRLLAELGRNDEAAAALTAALASAPGLEPWTRYHLARLHESIGRPAIAAALAVAVLSAQPPRPLLEDTLTLLERTVAAGGDCRVLGKLPPLSWRPEELRQLALMRAECAWRDDRKTQALAELTTLLRQKVGDDPALIAAGRLAARVPLEGTDGRTALLMGATFYEHRDFQNALRYLGRALAEKAGGYEAQFSIARSLFWLEDHAAAAAAFGGLADAATVAGERAQARYHQGRAFELAALGPSLDAVARGEALEQASQAFAQTLALAPDGRLASAGAVSLVRLDYLRGREEVAQSRVASLIARRDQEAASQTLMFLIASELSRGRVAKVAPWLIAAGRLGQTRKTELQYWQARLDELEGRLPAAAEGYLRLAMAGPYDPVAQQAWHNLRQEKLAAIGARRARQLAESVRADELAFAWRYLGEADEAGQRAHNRLAAQLIQDPRAAPLLRLLPRQPAEWPLWRLPLGQGLDQLAALGQWDDVAGAWSRYFPSGDPGLALAGSRAFTAAGAWKRGISFGENLGKRAPAQLAAPLLPSSLRQAIYPLGPAELLDRSAARFQIDRTLLAAIVREESRFDPEALSAASARGLTQFILPTAQRLAKDLELGPLQAQDLHRPEIAIALGAAHLAELARAFGRQEAPIVAAYNAGAPQARLWQSYCYSDDPVEYLTKVGFKETRDYLTKVLTSRAHYREIYPPPSPPPIVQVETPPPSGS